MDVLFIDNFFDFLLVYLGNALKMQSKLNISIVRYASINTGIVQCNIYALVKRSLQSLKEIIALYCNFIAYQLYSFTG